jgi:hypothetical protein
MKPNLYARIARGIVLELRMPAPDGTIAEPIVRKDGPAPALDEPQWFAIEWPVNPHDTGERNIRLMLERGWHTTRWAREDAHA